MAQMIEVAVSPAQMRRLARLERASGLLTANLRTALDAMAQDLVGAITSHMHFWRGDATGELESSIETQEPAPLERKIGSAVAHAAFVEFGTGQRGAASGVVPFGGYSYGSRAGMMAEPYLQPALADEMGILEGIVQQAVETTLAGLRL